MKNCYCYFCNSYDTQAVPKRNGSFEVHCNNCGAKFLIRELLSD